MKLFSKPYSCLLKSVLSPDNTQAEVIGSSNTYGVFHQSNEGECLFIAFGGVCDFESNIVYTGNISALCHKMSMYQQVNFLFL